jgi:heme exporter protein D
MLGIPDPWVWLAYLLSILSTLGCVVYGVMKWNSGAQEVKEDDRQWARREDEVEEKL